MSAAEQDPAVVLARLIDDARATAARLERATGQARQLLHETRGVANDLAKSKRGAAEAAAALGRETVKPHVEAAVASGLADYRQALDRAIDEATAAVFRRFDHIADLLLGESRKQARAGAVSLTSLAEHLAGGHDVGEAGQPT